MIYIHSATHSTMDECGGLECENDKKNVKKVNETSSTSSP